MLNPGGQQHVAHERQRALLTWRWHQLLALRPPAVQRPSLGIAAACGPGSTAALHALAYDLALVPRDRAETLPHQWGCCGDVTGCPGACMGKPPPVSMSDWQKTHRAGTARDTGATVTKIDLTAEARQLLKLLPSNSDNAAAAATAPASPYVTSPSR